MLIKTDFIFTVVKSITKQNVVTLTGFSFTNYTYQLQEKTHINKNDSNPSF